MIDVSTTAFDATLDFWRLARSSAGPVVSVREADSPDSSLEHALVYLRGGDAPKLYRFDDGSFVFARVTPPPKESDSLREVARLEAVDGSGVSFILEDPARHVVYVPFSVTEAVHAFQCELYRPPEHASRRAALAVYYAVKRVLPRAVLMSMRSAVARRQARSLSFPRWPVETSTDDLHRRVLTLLLRVANTDKLPFVWLWPHGKQAAVTLTHDVEGADGCAMIERFIDAEAEFAASSSFNLVPAKYEIPESLRETIEASGCEVGVHGWDHEGSLVSDRGVFLDRAVQINEVAREWGAAGFRSPSTYRNAEWFEDLHFAYDSSFPDTDPYEPQAGGCLSVFPFMWGNKVELPITMPQDHTLFRLLGESDAAVWRAKAEALMSRHGLICMLTHPDTAPGYTGCEPAHSSYRSMLGAFAADDTLWRALPREVARWWRYRARTEVDSAREEGLRGPGAADGRLAFARLSAGQLALEIADARV